MKHRSISESVTRNQRKDLKTVYFNVDTGCENYQDRDKNWKKRRKGYEYNHRMKKVTKPLDEMRLMECTELKMSAPEAYDIDITADDIDVTDIVTVVWEIY